MWYFLQFIFRFIKICYTNSANLFRKGILTVSKLLKAAGSIASPMASLGMAFGKKLKANAADEIKNPAKNNLYKNVNRTVAKILGTEPEKDEQDESQKDKNLQDKVAKLTVENMALKQALSNIKSRQLRQFKVKV